MRALVLPLGMTLWMALPLDLGCTLKATSSTPPATTAPTGVLGEDARVGFSFHNNADETSCTFGCAMMLGTQETVRIDPPQAADVVIESSDATIVAVSSGFKEIAGGGGGG